MAHVQRPRATSRELTEPVALTPRFFHAGAGGGAGRPRQQHFLDACTLCGKRLARNRDIFMYRGDVPFCSEECRSEQIEMDEATANSATNGAWGRRGTVAKAETERKATEDARLSAAGMAVAG